MKYMMFVATDPEGEPFDPALDNAEQWGGQVRRVGTADHGRPAAAPR